MIKDANQYSVMYMRLTNGEFVVASVKLTEDEDNVKLHEPALVIFGSNEAVAPSLEPYMPYATTTTFVLRLTDIIVLAEPMVILVEAYSKYLGNITDEQYNIDTRIIH